MVVVDADRPPHRVDRLAVPGLVDAVVLTGRGHVRVDGPSGLVVGGGLAVGIGSRGGLAGVAAPAGVRLQRRGLLGMQVRGDAVGLRLQAQLRLGGLVRIGGLGMALDGLGHRVVAGGAGGATAAAQLRTLPAAGEAGRAVARAHVHECGGGDDGDDDDGENDFHGDVRTRRGPEAERGRTNDSAPRTGRRRAT